jgi:hypothetical protein
MKHIKKFEEIDYKELLAQQSRLRQELEKSKQEEMDRIRKEMTGKRLSELSAEAEKSRKKEDAIKERQELTHLVIQAIIYSEQNKDGFDNFKKDLKELLNQYPLENLPKSGTSIYRED